MITSSLKIVLIAGILVLLVGCTSSNEPSGTDTIVEEPSLTPQDITPTNLYAIPGNERIELYWTAPVKGTIIGYKVFRTTVPNALKEQFSNLTLGSLIPETNFVDEGLVNDLIYYYAVVAVDESGIESDFSNIVAAIPFKVESDENAGSEETDIFSECRKETSELKKDICFKETAIANNNEKGCEELVTLSKDDCFYQIALSKGDDSICLKISDVSKKNDCIQLIALNNESIENCLKISVDENLEERDSCLLNIGTEQLSDAACEYIENLQVRDSCFKEVAVGLTNYALCKKISTFRTQSGFIRDECLSSILSSLKDENICPNFLDKDLKENCFKEVALEKEDLNVCRKISEIEKIDECIKAIAEKVLDKTICDEISTESIRQECITFISENLVLSVEECLEITSFNERNTCLYNSGIANLDASACSEIGDRDLKNNCFYNIAIDLNSSELCENIKYNAYSLIDDCYSTIALNLLDTSLCEKIPRRTPYVECYSDIAIKVTQKEVCEQCNQIFYPQDYITQDSCYYNYGTALSDEEACNSILNEDLRQQCLNSI
jgi:hypothetical protein